MTTQQEYEDAYESSRLSRSFNDWKRVRAAMELFIRREARRPYPSMHYSPLHAALRYVHLIDYRKNRKSI